MDVARWVRPAIDHAQDILSGALGQEWSINSCSLFFVFFLSGGSSLCSTFRAFFITGFFLFCVGCVLFFKIHSFVLGLSSDFFVFCSFVFRLESSLQKRIIYPVLSWF